MTGESLIERLIAEGPVLADGGWGTEMQARGLEAGELGDVWNLQHPERVEEVARAYVEAGSRVIMTNTFRASRVALERYGVEEQAVDINRAAVEISKRAAGERAFVFASIGPSGKMLFTGQVDEATLSASFTEQAKALADAGADALVVETMADLAEAHIALTAALETGLPVVSCMVFDSGKNRDRTMTGVSPAQAAAELDKWGAHVIGANCGIGIEQALGIYTEFASATDKPIWIKPNAGIPQLVKGEIIYQTTPEEFASYVPNLVEAGAKFVGGCCGTNPAFVKAIRAQLDSLG